MAKSNMEKQDIAISQMSKAVRNHREGDKTMLEKEVEKNREKPAYVPPKKPQISHYVPNHPLNGIFGKSLAEQKEIAEEMKAKGLIKRKGSSGNTEPIVEVPGYKIISAQYGVPGNYIEMAHPNLYGKIGNRMAGSDPIPGKKKEAIFIVEKLDGTQITKTFTEGHKISVSDFD